jgi:hypothetical protein
MWKLIAVAISSLSLMLTALPVHAFCTSGQIQACTDQSNTCSSDCSFNGAGQSCYNGCVCGYYECRVRCGDGQVPDSCGSIQLLIGHGGADLVLSRIEVEVNASPKVCQLAAES